MFEEESEVYKLFISHIDRDDEEYDLFITRINASYDFQWENLAVCGGTSPDDIKKQMEPADVVVILSGLISKDQPLLTRQINAAKELKKPIVVIRPYGMENVPFDLEEIASEIVGWNTPCIVDAIRDSILLE